jgi:transcriptional regulator with XRE-family HTH domain
MERGGDLSRRVAHRRTELGLSLEETGKESGLDPGYLKYLERHAEAHLRGGSLILLSMALKTTPEALLGANAPPRHDRGASGPHPDVEPLTSEQCEVRLGSVPYGRLVYSVVRGPAAIPVNYENTDGQIVISTD